jgi:ABC-2 type transport system permease protein
MRAWLRLCVVGGRISYKALFNWTSPLMYIPTLLISPLLGTLFFAYLGRYAGGRDDTFYVLGNGLLAVAGPCVFGGMMALANERRYQTLGAVLGTPAPRGAILVGRALPYVANGVFTATVVTAVACALLRVSIRLAEVPALLMAAVAAAAACTAFGLALGAIGMRVRDVWVISNTVWVSLWLVSGANVPRSSLPGWLDAVGGALPISHAIDAARAVAHRDPYLGLVVRELAVGVCWSLGAAALFRVFERSGRRHAALDRG